ncbi:MAG: cytochrome P450 [Pseudomonadales bacterium]|nr:cytochrome P450 [Pseudomonadales bacterium]
MSDALAKPITPIHRPPRVKGLPLIGSSVPLLRNPHEFVKKAYKNYGDVFRFEAGPRKFVVIGGVDANRFVAGEGKDYFTNANFFGEVGKHYNCPHMLVMLDGEIHKYQRQLMAPLLKQQALTDRLPEMAGNITDIIANAASKKTIAFGPFARQMLSNQLSQTFQGYKASHKKIEQLIFNFNAVNKVYSLRSMPKAYLYTPRVLLTQRVLHDVTRKSVKVAERRIGSGVADSPYYLDNLIPKLKEKPEWFNEGDIQAHALLLFVGALDTISATKGFMIKRLLQNPLLYQRIQREVDEVFSAGIPSLKTLRNMQDLNGFFRETMRVQPTGFGVVRTATQDFNFKGYQIYKDEDVMVFTTADHMNEKYFPNPESFDIDRYREPVCAHKQQAYAPFGKGPHNCLGASLSELIMPLHMGLMLYHLDFRAGCDLNKVKVVFNPAPVLSSNFKVRVSLRREI